MALLCVRCATAALLALGLGACASSGQAAPADPTMAGLLDELDRLPTPADADPLDFAALKGVLREQLLRTASAPQPRPPAGSVNRVGDLALSQTGGQWRLTWTYRSSGDYNRDGEVNVSDLSPLGRYFNTHIDDPDWGPAQVADGDGNGLISLGDVTPIGANLITRVSGYAVLGARLGLPFVELGTVAYAPPSGTDLTFTLAANDYDWYAVAPLYAGQRGAVSCAVYREPGQLEFSGHQWTVRRVEGQQGPGPNYWPGQPAQVCVEQPGTEAAELRLTAGMFDGRFASAEVYTEPLGYGTYIFQLSSPVTPLHHNIVLGLFTYDFTAAGALSAHSELDIELAKFGIVNDVDYLQFAVQPSFSSPPSGYVTFPERARRLPVAPLGSGPSTHIMQWTPTRVRFASYPGLDGPTPQQLSTWSFGSSAQTWSFESTSQPRVYDDGEGNVSGPVVIPPPGQAGAHINLWWFRQGPDPGAPPTTTVRVRRFDFIPL
jgi:hypothetical protein